jgi:hypothetical protein
VIISASAYSFLKWLDAEDEEEEEEQRAHHTPRLRREGNNEGEQQVGDEYENEYEDEEWDDVIMFLPTGLSRARPRTFYKGSDEEWQEFMRIAPDKERTKRIRMELVSMIRGMAAGNEQYKRRLGNITTNKGNVWIEIKFPDGPPIEYERPGIEITEDLEVRKATRPVPELHHQRINHALLPTAVASSLYADGRVKVARSWSDFRSYMGWEDESTKKNKEALAKILSSQPLYPNPNAASPKPTPSTPDSTPTPSATGAPQQQPANPASTPTPSPQKEQAISALGGTGLDRFLPALPPPTNLTLNLTGFRMNLMKKHKQYTMSPPRGTFIVSGLIEIIGDRARMTLDVSAYYDPKQGKYVFLKAQLRNITDYRQYPKGGH